MHAKTAKIMYISTHLCNK